LLLVRESRLQLAGKGRDHVSETLVAADIEQIVNDLL
jgi:hypothetical protein